MGLTYRLFILAALFVCTTIALALGQRILVNVGGNGTSFTTIQAAVDYVATLKPGSPIATIRIPSGIYREKVQIPRLKAKLRITGQDRNSTVITNDDFSGKPIPGTNTTYGTSTSYTLLVKANQTTIENLTIRNTAGRVGQAVALYVTGDQFVLRNSNVLGNQDTLYAGGVNAVQSRQYYQNCYVEGTTDFIFGGGTAIFESCLIRSLMNSYTTAASTIQENRYGFVFRNCTLDASQEATKVYLGRPWRPYAKTVYLNTRMGSHIVPAGWDNWGNPSNEETVFYAEYGTTGVDVTKRVGWSKQLNAGEAGVYTNANIFRVLNGSTSSTWEPNNNANN